jgi:hypothetical protein
MFKRNFKVKGRINGIASDIAAAADASGNNFSYFFLS